MNKQVKFRNLLESAQQDLNRYDELTESEKNELIKSLAIAQQISADRSNELNQEMEEMLKKMEGFEQRYEELQTELVARDAFLLEKDLGDEFEEFVEQTVAEYVKELKKTKLTLVKN